MRRNVLVLMVASFCWCLLAGAAGAADPLHHSLGPGTGSLQQDGTRDLPCGFGHLAINSDQWYENGYAWQGGGSTDPPDWGSFAECYEVSAPMELCAVVLDFSTPYPDYHMFTLDAYLWADDQGAPGNVLSVTRGFDPFPVGVWPTVSRHVVPLVHTVEGAFWVGYWVDFDGYAFEWAVMADCSGDGAGCPFTKIAPGIGYPTGWNHVSAVWGHTDALGLGYYGHNSVTAGTPSPAARGEEASWGRVKSLYR